MSSSRYVYSFTLPRHRVNFLRSFHNSYLKIDSVAINGCHQETVCATVPPQTSIWRCWRKTNDQSWAQSTIIDNSTVYLLIDFVEWSLKNWQRSRHCRMFALNIKDWDVFCRMIALEMSRGTDIVEWSQKLIKTSCANDYTYCTMIFRYSNA